MFSKKTMVMLGLIGLFVATVLLVSLSGRYRFGAGPVGGAIVWLVAPLEEGTTFAARSLRSLWKQYFDLVLVADENQRLTRERDELQQLFNRCTEAALAAQRLREFSDFSRRVPHRVITAKIVGADPSFWFRSILINRGGADGVKEGFPVIAPAGVVGQVSKVFRLYSRVLLIVDPTCGVDARIQRTRARGIVEGWKKGTCRMKYVLSKEYLQVGDVVVSSGLDGVFPEGLRIGSVSAIETGGAEMFQQVTVSPGVDFGKLEEVLVVVDSPSLPFSDPS
ncbi:rod shape-determining protein MreC [Thermodesulfobacteriota bacterium]